MVREFIIGRMEIRGKGIGRMVKNMGMLYFIRRMEGKYREKWDDGKELESVLIE
jgi:hypothetical protein